MIEKNYKKLSFLNNKRMSLLNSEKNIVKSQDINLNLCNFYKNEILKNDLNVLNNLENKTIKAKIFKISKDFSKLKKIKYSNFCKNNNNNKKYNVFNYLYKIENCDYIFINKSDIKKNQQNNQILNKDINKKTNRNNNSNENNSNKINNNQINVKKNNKMIYMNKCLIKTKYKNNEVIVGKRKRSSRYRGVSKNGSKWQVYSCSKNIREYIGTYKTQEIAARIYDIISIKNKGIKAKTNFKYDLHKIQKISDTYIDYSSNNIDEIISQLID